jgi:hypothetical protein
MPHYRIEISDTASQKEVQNSTIGGKSDVGTLLGRSGANFGALPREQHNSKQCPLQWNALGPADTNYSNQMFRSIIRSDIMLHDNAHPYSAAHTVESLCQQNFVLKHSPHRPNLASSDYHQSGPLRDTSERLPFCRWPWSKRSGACVACHSTRNILSSGHTEVCGLLN